MQFAHKYGDPKRNRQKSMIADISDYLLVRALRLSFTKQGAWQTPPSPLFCRKEGVRNQRTHQLALTVAAAVQSNISNGQSDL
jgi:hypothetical protein